MTTDANEESEHKMTNELKASLDGELSIWRAGRVRLHLLCCASCREERAWLRRLGSEMKELERATPRPELRAKILASLPEVTPLKALEPASRRPLFTSNSASPRYALGVAALAVVSMLITGSVYAYRRHTETAVLLTSNPATQTAQTRPSLPAFPPQRKAEVVSNAIPETLTPPTPTSNDFYSTQATRMVADDVKRERLENERLKREERRRHATLVAQGKPTVETPVLKLASAEGGATGEGFLNSFRATVAKVDGKISGVPQAKRFEEAMITPVKSEREVAVRVPAEKVEAFLNALNSVGRLTKVEGKTKLRPSPYSITSNDEIGTADFITPQFREEIGSGQRPNVVVVQPDRKGYVLLHVRLVP